MSELMPDEKIVYDLIVSCNGRITQLDIARSASWLGSHPIHESHLNINHQQSTLRKIRQIIRDLRIKHHLFILSDVNGYWIMKDRSEAIEYIQRIEKTAKAQAKSWYVTYQCMRRNFGINSDYFETQGKLF
jgi:hypothetical protein